MHGTILSFWCSTIFGGYVQLNINVALTLTCILFFFFGTAVLFVKLDEVPIKPSINLQVGETLGHHSWHQNMFRVNIMDSNITIDHHATCRTSKATSAQSHHTAGNRQAHQEKSIQKNSNHFNLSSSKAKQLLFQICWTHVPAFNNTQ